jgi:hypothetical protein
MNAATDLFSALPGMMEQDATEAIMARSRGQTSRLHGLKWHNEFQAIITGPRCSVRRPLDLRDCRVGLPSLSGSRLARAAALRGALSALESQGLNHRHADWIELTVSPHTEAFSAELEALQRGSVDAVYVRGAVDWAAARAIGARVVFDIGVQRDPWLRSQTALLMATVAQVTGAHSSALPGSGLDDETLQVARNLKHFLLRWEFISDDFDLQTWADLRPEGSASRRNAAASVFTASLVL